MATGMRGSSSKRAATIAVFGSSRRDPQSALYHEAVELGRRLAGAGYTVLNGGYGGSMAAVSRGAAEAGGHVVGVTCDIFDPAAPNAWLSQEIRTPDLMSRLARLVEQADGFVALRGGIGTLAEITLVWSLLQTNSLVGKPLILLGSDWQAVVDALVAHTDLGSSIAGLAQVVTTPAQVMEALARPALPTPPGPPPQG